jgi:hypothetical protein
MPLVLISKLVENSIGWIEIGLNKARQLRASFAGSEPHLNVMENHVAGNEMIESKR